MEFTRTLFEACENGSFGKMFGGESYLSSYSYHSHKNLDAAIYIGGETETGGNSQLLSSRFGQEPCFKNKVERGQRDSSVVKGACCSCRGSGFYSQYPHNGLQLSPVPGI